MPCPSLGLQCHGCRGQLKKLKMPKAASLELTPLPGQVPPAPALGCWCPGSSPPKPAVPGDMVGWHGSRGSTAAGAARGPHARAPHAPDLQSNTASMPVGAKDGGGLAWDTAHGWTVRHHVTWADKLIPGLQPQAPPSHCSSTSASALHHRLWPGSGHHHWVQPAPRVPSPPLLITRTFPPPQGRVSATNALSTGTPSAAQRSRDMSHFACGLARAWLCCVSVLAVS